MASGKSTVGRLLATKLQYDFLDLDENIEDVTGQRIAEIFDTVGESGFRSIEKHALDATATKRKTVIALGGGAVVSNVSLHFAKSHGIVVYLRASVQVIVERLKTSSERPLVSKNANVIDDYVRDTINERSVFYEAADVVVDVDAKVPDEIANEIVSVILGS